MVINRLLAQELAAEINAVPKECYRNSALALFAYPGKARYVEGWLGILEGQILIDHGWLEVDGQIVDVTLQDVEAEHYHPVAYYTRAQIERKIAYRGSVTVPLAMLSADAHEAMRRAYGALMHRYDEREE